MSLEFDIGNRAKLSVRLDNTIVDAEIFYAIADIQSSPTTLHGTGPDFDQIQYYMSLAKYSPSTPIVMSHDDISASVRRLLDNGKLEKYIVEDTGKTHYRVKT